jgi:hypothetical protein
LHELIEKINKCKAYFIRCIKPNPNQENVFLNEFVIKQLRYCSIMHVCKIRKCGFPYRIHFEEFLKWYVVVHIYYFICVYFENLNSIFIFSIFSKTNKSGIKQLRFVLLKNKSNNISSSSSLKKTNEKKKN